MYRQRTPSSWIQHDVAVLDVAVERERHIHDGELQSLGRIHRHHLHGSGVAIQPAVAFGCAAAFVALLAQPVAQSRQAQPLAMRDVLQQLRDVRKIGHVPFAVLPGQHPITHAAQLRGFVDGRHPAFPGMRGPFPQRVRNPIGQRITAGRKRFRGLAEEHRRRGGVDHPGAVRLVERLQQTQPVFGGLRGEHVGVAGVDRRNARIAQRLEACAGVLVPLHDHRDVAGPQRLAVECRAAGQQRADIGGEVGADMVAQLVDR